MTLPSQAALGAGELTAKPVDGMSALRRTAHLGAAATRPRQLRGEPRALDGREQGRRLRGEPRALDGREQGRSPYTTSRSTAHSRATAVLNACPGGVA